MKFKYLPILLASGLLIGGTADVSAQDWNRERDQIGERDDRGWRGRDRDGDRDRGWRGRDRDDDRAARGRGRDDDDDRGTRGQGRDDERDRRGRGRDDDRDRRWRGGDRGWGDADRGRNCYEVRRRIVERNGDVLIRRSRVCQD